MSIYRARLRNISNALTYLLTLKYNKRPICKHTVSESYRVLLKIMNAPLCHLNWDFILFSRDSNRELSYCHFVTVSAVKVYCDPIPTDIIIVIRTKFTIYFICYQINYTGKLLKYEVLNV